MFKKAVEGEIFRWIFILIAGALILIFFIRFAFQQTDIFKSINVREITENLDDQFQGLSNSKEAYKELNFLDELNFKFKCNSFSLGDYEKKTNRIIFSEDLKGKTLESWTKSWEFPYKVDNFYYLTDNMKLYYLVLDDNSRTYVENLKIPVTFTNIKKVHVNALNDNRVKFESRNMDEAMFVFFTSERSYNSGIKKKVITVDYKNNELTIDGRGSFYLGEEMLMGAILDPDDYECLKEKAINKFKILTSLYKQESTYLISKTNDNECRSRLVEMRNTLESFGNQLNTNSLNENRDKVEHLNRELERNGCSKIY